MIGWAADLLPPKPGLMRRSEMGEKGMDAGGVADQVAAAPADRSDYEAMGTPVADPGQGQPQPESSGPDVGEVVEDIIDPLGIHKLFP
jgi:hypothetical protein